jgi:hypothetical protein
MTAPHEERARWTIQEAGRLLLSLKGVLSARVVARPGGNVEEIHLLTTDDVKPKQTVRNVESALLSRLDLAVDHRKISVAQTQDRPLLPVSVPEVAAPLQVLPEPAPSESRLLFYGHQVETESSNQVRHKVDIEWQGERYSGAAVAADIPRAKLEAVGQATLQAVEVAAQERLEEGSRGITLALDGVKVVDAFDRSFVLVAVHAMNGRNVTSLTGATVVDGSPDRAAIMATLQATDRWVRGRL